MTEFRKLGCHAAHRDVHAQGSPRALCDLLDPTIVSQLVKHERIETTVAKAKEVSRLADNMLQLGKKGILSSARRAATFVRLDGVLHQLFTELAYRYKPSQRIHKALRTHIRVGDTAPKAYIKFIDRENEVGQSKPPTPQPSQRTPLDPWSKSKLSARFALPKEERTSSVEVAP